MKKPRPQKPTLVKTTPDGGIRLHIAVEISGAELRAWDTARLGVFFRGLSGVLTARSVETVLHGLEAERERNRAGEPRGREGGGAGCRRGSL